MKAMVYTRYGSPDVLELKEVPKPVPKAGEVLVRVHATALNAADWRLLTGTPRLLRLMFGLFRPKHPVLGADVAGRVEAVGKDVKGFKPGDEVFGDLSGSGLGGLAEYVCAKEQALALKPPRLAFEEAAAVPMAAVTALQGLRDAGGIRPGQEVLINGASGGVGTFAVQIAKALGARVTAVCSSQKVDLARSLGADHVVDYAKEDFTKSGRSYDLILDVAAYRPFSEYRPALGPQGVYALVGGHFNRILQVMLRGPWASRRGGQRFRALMAKPDPADLAFVSGLLEAGKVVPVIERRYPLLEAAEALRYLGQGHARGKLVVVVRQEPAPSSPSA